MGEYQACVGEYQACMGVPSMLYVLPRLLAAAMMPCPDRGALFFAWGIVFRDRCHQRTWNVFSALLPLVLHRGLEQHAACGALASFASRSS